MLINATVSGIANLSRVVRAEGKRHGKALETAIRIEGFRLRKQLMKELRASAPGGKKFKPMRAISRRFGGRFLPDKPFANKTIQVQVGRDRWRKFSMTDVIRYHITRQPDFQMAIGWTGPHVSKSWKRIAKKQQEGFEMGVPSYAGKYFAKVGATLGKRSRNRKFFFLRKSTRRFKVPARPIIAPFWAAHKREAMSNIRRNFFRKLRGERI